MQINYSGNIPNTTAPASRPPLTGDAVWMRSDKGALHADGQWLKAADGTIVQLQGVVLSHAQKTCLDITNPYGLGNAFYPAGVGVWSTPGFFSSIAAWNVNCVKFQINPRLWVDGCPHRTGDPNSATYRTMVQNAIAAAQAAGLYVIICNLDYYLPGGGNWPAPDTSYTPWFWGGRASDGIPGIAQLYASDQTVLFETFSEPHGSADGISGSIWLNGGTVNWSGPTYTAYGVQNEINVIAAAAPNSVILVDHKDFATTPGGENPYLLPSASPAWAWAAHIYDSNNNAPPYKWPGNWGTLAQSKVLVATEFGDFNIGTGTYLTNLLNYFLSNLAGWTAFTYDNDPRQWARPSLLKNGDASAYSAGHVSNYAAPIQAWYLANFRRK